MLEIKEEDIRNTFILAAMPAVLIMLISCEKGHYHPDEIELLAGEIADFMMSKREEILNAKT